MSDMPLKNLKIPPELVKQLKDADTNLTAMRKNLDGLKSMGIDTTDLEKMYSDVSRAREVMLKALGE